MSCIYSLLIDNTMSDFGVKVRYVRILFDSVWLGEG